MTTTNFPIDLDNARNIHALLIGLEDEKVRSGLKDQKGVPEGVIELVHLIEDEKFLSMAGDLVNELQEKSPYMTAPQGRSDERIRLEPPDSAKISASRVKEMETRETINLDGIPVPETVAEMSERINKYLKVTYPAGSQLLMDYQNSAYGDVARIEAGSVAANAWAVANAAAVANAVVYANVAVATMAAAVLAVGAFVVTA